MSESAAASIAWTRRKLRSGGVLAVSRVELAKIAAQTPARLAAGICVLAPFAFVGILRAQQAVPADTLFGRWVHVSGFAVPLVILGFAGAWGFPVLAGLAAGDIFSSEDRHNTWKLVLTRSRSRFAVFTGKLVAATCFAVASLTLLAVSSIAAGVLVVGTKPLIGLSGTTIPAGRALTLVATSWALALPPLLGFTAIAALLSLTTRSSVVGVLGPVVLGLGLQLLALVGTGEVVRTLLLGTAFDAWHGLFLAHADYRMASQAALVCGVYVLLCLTAAWSVLRRRDIAGNSPGRRPWVAPVVALAAAALLVGAAAGASGLGPAGITAGRLDAAIGPTFANLVVLQQRWLGRRIPAGASPKVLETCLRRGAADPYRGAGDDWTCTLSLVASNLRQLPVNYDVNVRPNGCYTAEGPATIGGVMVRGTPNPLHAFDGCFEP